MSYPKTRKETALEKMFIIGYDKIYETTIKGKL